ncbi:L,D-transpeptidase [Pseudonocardia sp. CA-107938]|uniref:L,D-transpeptidase n=1 Tax=Pseudonocardia sp. CA-107938 TaxID=3240021 RepID=UPI003D8F1655
MEGRAIVVRRVITGAGIVAVAAAATLIGGQAIAEPAAPSSAAQAHQALPLVDGTPCTATARACVDLDSGRAWLFQDGAIVRGPVAVGLGAKDRPTPPGHSLRVYLKDKDRVSSESSTDGVPDPMPYAVFFNDGGIAFHAGQPDTFSSGCVKLPLEDAKAWFDHLQVGDQVQVLRASEEHAERGLPAPEA